MRRRRTRALAVADADALGGDGDVRRGHGTADGRVDIVSARGAIDRTVVLQEVGRVGARRDGSVLGTERTARAQGGGHRRASCTWMNRRQQ